MQRLIIISNRLPVKIELKDGEILAKKSEGGLATGLDSLTNNYERHWIGWPGIYPENKSDENRINAFLEKDNIYPVYLSKELIELYYEGYCNDTIWPLFHYFFVYVRHNQMYWQAYQEANTLFLKKALEIAQPDDIIWVHDYQLMLLPGLLRENLPESKIGFFLHIPFPAYELFRNLTSRKEILHGLLGADLIGFHTFDYMRHFLNSAYRIMGVDTKQNEISYDNRVVYTDTFPMGIAFDKYHNAFRTPDVIKYIDEYQKFYGNQKIILSVDRLDYTKGILHRLSAFDMLLDQHPEYKGKVSLLAIVVPSRDTVAQYKELKNRIDEKIGYINGKYSDMNWVPIFYLYRGLPFEPLSALYHLSDIALVTPLRDGMNLVAKEYAAAKNDKPGVLILSEMAGAAIELTDAIIINPNSIEEITDAMHTALIMPEEEQKQRLEKMQAIIRRDNVDAWASGFIGQLQEVHTIRSEIQKKIFNNENLLELKADFDKAESKLLLLDYDGTLVPLIKDPAKAIPDKKLMGLLKKLTAKSGVTLSIISGRDYTFMDKYFGSSDIELIAEHGSFYKENKFWVKAFSQSDDWKKEIYPIMQKITDKTPGSCIEEKNSAIVWHYKKCDDWLADLREHQLINLLVSVCTKNNLHLMRGNKIVEVMVSELDKGNAAKRLLNKKSWDFILAMGDDTTDENLFAALPEYAYSIRIGTGATKARFNIMNQKAALKILEKLAE